MRVQKDCETCEGSGRVTENTCIKCEGRGSISHLSDLEITIPSQTKTGDTIEITDLEDEVENNIEKIILTVHIISSDRFKIDEQQNITRIYPIDALHAVVGGEIFDEVLQTKIQFPEYTSHETVLPFKEKGLKCGDKISDYFINFHLTHLKKLSASQMEALNNIIKNTE